VDNLCRGGYVDTSVGEETFLISAPTSSAASRTGAVVRAAATGSQMHSTRSSDPRGQDSLLRVRERAQSTLLK